MALDGMMLHLIAGQLRQSLLGARVDKVSQPAREELILSLHSLSGNYRLLLSANASSPRTHLTALSVENPKQPPMFCMLLRKVLGGARLVRIEQPGFERVLMFCFETTSELGDPITVTLAAEIMGRYSNLIMIGPDGRITDAVKKVGADRSSLRQILPGLSYVLPPPQSRIAVTDPKAVVERLLTGARDIELSKFLQETLEGASPILCREIAHRACSGAQMIVSELMPQHIEALRQEICALARTLEQGECLPTAVFTPDGDPKDFSFIPVTQYGNAMQTRTYPNLSELLDDFYGEKDAVERMKQKMLDLSRLIGGRIERIERKLAAQQQELLDCKNRDKLRRSGDLLSASLYRLEKGMKIATVTDFFDPQGGEVEIPLDPLLTPVQNIQRYYKDYRRADTAERMLKGLIEQGEQELSYLDTVQDLMVRARAEDELSAIRSELSQSGYLRTAPGQKRRREQKLPPLRYRSSDGFLILSGRNNLQNDQLTLRDSAKADIWFHVQKLAGSHTVVVTQGKEPPDSTLTEAAVIAAVNSRARKSAKVPVDYTAVKNVRKQPGGRPGMVIYENFRTAVVDPDEELAERLKLRE